MKADLTKTKNKSLVGADLSETSFLLANLSGVNLSDTTLAATNFLRTTLIGVDFTNLSNIPNGVLFVKSTLTNSNFEGVNMSPIHVKIDTFENKAYLKQEYESGILSARTLVVTLFDSGLDNKQIGKQLGISEHTVKTHLRNIYSKTNTHNRTNLALSILSSE